METSDNTLVARIVLEKAFTERLQTAEVDEYRRNYLRFRKGKANGAKGEGPGDADPEDDSVSKHNPTFIPPKFLAALPNFESSIMFSCR